MTARVVLADDSFIVREGLTRLLEGGGCRVVAAVGDGEELRRAVALEAPDIAVVDIRMPPTHTDEGIVAARTIRRDHPGTAVLVLSQYVEAEYALELLDGGRGGLGYLLKDRILDRASLLAALWRVLAGEVVVDAALVESLLEGAPAAAGLSGLSGRERQVLALMAEGLTDRGIAERLSVSPKTVATHVVHIFAGLAIPHEPAYNKRVRAVLAYLQAT